MQKMPSMARTPAGAHGTQHDNRQNGRWLWAAVLVGKGNEVYTHANGKTKFTSRLPPNRAELQNGKPKGYETIRNTLASVSPRVPSSSRTNGPRQSRLTRPAANNELESCDLAKKFHSNDITYENERLKAWASHRYNKLQLSDLDLHEYAFHVNAASAMADVTAAMSDWRRTPVSIARCRRTVAGLFSRLRMCSDSCLWSRNHCFTRICYIAHGLPHRLGRLIVIALAHPLWPTPSAG